MAVLYVYGLFFVSKWLELRSVFRTLLPQQSKLWFSFLCRGVKNNQEVWVNVQRLIWRKGNHLSPLEFGGVYHETECKKKKKTHTGRWRKSKEKLFFPPVFCSQVKVASWWSVFFSPLRGCSAAVTDRSDTNRAWAGHEWEIMTVWWKQLLPGLITRGVGSLRRGLRTRVRHLRRDRRGVFFTLLLVLFRSRVWAADYNLMIGLWTSRYYLPKIYICDIL